MIQVTYLADFAPGSVMAEQEAAMSFQPLDDGELTLLGLTILSDTPATWNGTQIQRVVTFDESSPQFQEVIGNGPSTEQDQNRKAAVTGLFALKIGARIIKEVDERIVLL